MNLLFLHGFWGQAADWNVVCDLILKKKTGWNLEALNYWQLIDRPENLNFANLSEAVVERQKTKNTVLVGYSLGGRLALHLTKGYPQYFSGSVLLSTHPGLKSTQERAERKKRDQAWAEKFAMESFVDLERAWQDQEVFNHTSALKHSHSEGLRPYLVQSLTSLSLAQQNPEDWGDNRLPELWLFGENDRKFANIYDNLDMSSSSREKRLLKGCGHRIFLDKPNLLANEIMDFTQRLWERYGVPKEN